MKLKFKGSSLGVIFVAIGVLLLALLTSAIGYPWIFSYAGETSPKLDVAGSNGQVVFQVVPASEAISLIDQWVARTVQNEGWVHVVARVDSDEEYGVVLPNGKLQPNSYLIDDWVYINGAGLVEKAIQRVIDLDGNVLQQGVFVDNVLNNLTFDIQRDQQPYEFNADFGFESYLQLAEAEGVQISETETVQDGKPSIMFTFTEMLEEPTEMGNEGSNVKSIKFIGFFGKDSGDLWLIQIIWTLENGEEKLFNSTQILSLESGKEPDDETLKILEDAK